jgi:hypothetical protein
MKRMSEVFELPLSQLPEADDQIQDANEDWALVVRLPWRTDYVVNAINNVDALADALEDVVKAWRFLCACNGYDEDHLVEFENAKKALQAYRGTK